MTARGAGETALRGSFNIRMAAATARAAMRPLRPLTLIWMLMLILAAAPRSAIAAPPTANHIEMELKISGTGHNGFEIEIRPGHRACRFQTIKKIIEPGKEQLTIKIDRFLVETISPDRDCCFEIVIREPGQADKAIKRGVRLDKPKLQIKPNGQEPETIIPVQRLTYYLASPAFSVIEKKPRIR